MLASCPCFCNTSDRQSRCVTIMARPLAMLTMWVVCCEHYAAANCTAYGTPYAQVLHAKKAT